MRYRSTAIVIGAVLVSYAAWPAPEAMKQTARQALASTGSLRVAVPEGSPLSVVRDEKTGEVSGLAIELGRELARRLGVPLTPVVAINPATAQEVLLAGRADVMVQNATAFRREVLDFAPELFLADQGLLVSRGVAMQTAADVDRAGVRVGVIAGGASQRILSTQLKRAQLVAVDGMDAGARALSSGRIEAFATNKATLFFLSARVPGSRVLDGHYETEHFAFAVPKGRTEALAFLTAVTEDLRRTGSVADMAHKLGVRGIVFP